MKLQYLLILVCIFVGIGSVVAFLTFRALRAQPPSMPTPAQIAAEETRVQISTSPTPSPLSSPIASPAANVKIATASAKIATPSASLADLNKQYGPCVQLPTLMYHHIQNLDVARAAGHASLTVGTQYFQKQMQYLKDKQYTVVKMQNLIDFFNHSTPLPKKPILLTFDDGYADFASDAVPILQSFGFAGTLFTPTGLIENPGYLTWSQIKSISQSGSILIANHTWSHHGLAASNAVIQKEVTLAQTQLHERGYDEPKTLAYPYGSYNAAAENFVNSKGYQVAFTTNHGSILCKGQRFELPRIRIGNAQLSAYGL